MKRCIVCGQDFPLENFPMNRRMPDGHLGWCFECWKHRVYARSATGEEPKKEKVSENEEAQQPKPKRSPKEIRRSNRSEETKERNRIYSRKYYHEHREQCRERERCYRQSERGRQRKAERMREYRKTEKYKAWLKARNAQRRLLYAKKKEERLQQQ